MKITCPTHALKEALRLTARGIQINSPIPALQHIKLETDSKIGLAMTATNYELEIRCHVGCEIKDRGSITVPAKQFAEIISAAAADTVEISDDSEGRLKIKSGRSQHRLCGMVASDFPSLPETQDRVGLILPQSLIHEMIAKTVHAVSKSETQPSMTGGCLSVHRSTARLAATDSRRLAVYDFSFEGDTGRNFDAILPKRSMTELLHFLLHDADEDVELRVDDSQVEFRTPFFQFKTRLIASIFPKIDPVIQLVSDNSHYITLPRIPLLEALKRTDILARDDNHVFRMYIDSQSVSLSAKVAGVGDYVESLEMDRDSCPLADVTIYLIADQIMEMLQAFSGEQIILYYLEPNRPILACDRDSSFFEILMPCQSPVEVGS
jgi:DNA polymerase-3 subunit beta